MKSSVSSKLRLLLDSSPLCDVDPETLAAQEDSVAAWQLDVGQELAAENIPLAHVVLVVEGTLRVSGRDALGNPFTLRRIHSGEWFGLWSALLGISATCRTTESTKHWSFQLKSGKSGSAVHLSWRSGLRHTPNVRISMPLSGLSLFSVLGRISHS